MKWETVRQAREILVAEEGTVIKDWGGRLPIALVYPNTYYVGMSSLGFQTLYRLLNGRQEVVAERVFWSPKGSTYSLETQQRLTDFAVLAISLSFELDILNLVDLFHRAGLPVLAAERSEDAPFVLVGGPVATANPELLAPLIDAAFIGEAEEGLGRLVDALIATATAPRSERRRAVSGLPGIYVPDENPVPVGRLCVDNLDAWPVHSAVLTPNTSSATCT